MKNTPPAIRRMRITGASVLDFGTIFISASIFFARRPGVKWFNFAESRAPAARTPARQSSPTPIRACRHFSTASRFDWAIRSWPNGGSGFDDQHAAMGVVADAVRGVAEQAAPQLGMIAVADDNQVVAAFVRAEQHGFGRDRKSVE